MHHGYRWAVVRNGPYRQDMAKTVETFVPGGLPEVTYIPRDALHLERSVRDYLSERFRVLSLSGPTKSGKTVLIRRIVPDAVFLSGGDIKTIDDFWAGIADALGGYQHEAKEIRRDEGERGSLESEIGASIGIQAKVHTGVENESVESRLHQKSRSRPDRLVAQEGLRDNAALVLVVDDFHYIEPDTQLLIIRGLKQMVFMFARDPCVGSSSRVRRSPNRD